MQLTDKMRAAASPSIRRVTPCIRIHLRQDGTFPTPRVTKPSPRFSLARAGTSRRRKLLLHTSRMALTAHALLLWLRKGSSSSAPPWSHFEDPVGVTGFGVPYGGRYPANGLATYTTAAIPGSYHVTCTIPQSEHQLRSAILNEFADMYGKR